MKDENNIPEKWNWQNQKDRPKKVKAKPKKKVKPKKEPKPKKEAKAKPSGGAKARGKKIWIWLTLLIVAAAIGIGVYFWLSASKTYTVTVTLDNGEVIRVEERFKEGANLKDMLSAYLTDAPTGYEYVWEGLPEDGKMPNGDLTVTAVLKAKKYTLTFDTDGGNTVASRQVDYNTAIGELLPPTKTGHTFVNWVKAGTGEEVTAAILMPLDGLTVKAVWTVNKYVLKSDVDGTVTAVELAYGSEIKLTNPVKTGYTFAGWTGMPSDGKMPDSDLTLTAQWTIGEYTLTFDTNGGNEIAAYKLEYNTALGNLEEPTRTGHTFLGWKDASGNAVTAETTMPSGDLTVKASWSVNSYELKYVYDNGHDVDTVQELAYGAEIELPAPPSKVGHTFVRWSWEGNPKPPKMPDRAVTLTAIWQATPYVLQFNTVGGTAIEPCNVDYGAPLGSQLPTPEKKPNPQDEYAFIRWVATLNGVETEVTAATLMPLGGLTVTAQWFELSNLEFTKIAEGNEYSVKCSLQAGTAKPSDVVIPASYNGIPVTEIGYYAFGGRTMKSVRIPSTVKTIGNSAFESCTALTSVVIPEGVTSIGEGTFKKCYALKSITIPSSVTSIGYSVFEECSSLTSVTIPEGVESIKSSTFWQCTGLTSVEIPSTVKTIEDRAFGYCSSLTSITIPEGVTSIDYAAFGRCSSLTSITIPKGVTSIAMETFAYCSALTSITIPEGVTSIGEKAFNNCTGLTSVIIPKSMTGIGDNAFALCSALTKIYYTGTPTDKAGLTVSATGNDPLNSAAWYYYSATEPDPTEPDLTDTIKYWHYDTDGVTVVEWQTAETV